MIRKFVAAISFMLIAVAGCDQPTILPEEVIGTWTLTEETSSRLPATLQGLEPKLVLLATGVFVVENVPAGLVVLVPDDVDWPLSGGGGWHLAYKDGKQVVQLNFRAFWDGAMQHVTPFGTQLDVSGDHDAILLFYYQGDPDSSLRIEFEKL